MNKITRRGYVKSSGSVLAFGSVLSQERIEEYPVHPVVANLKEGWEQVDEKQRRVERRGSDLLASPTYYQFTDIEDQLSEAIDVEVNLPLAGLFAFKAGQPRTRIELPLRSYDPGNDFMTTLGSSVWFHSAVGELYTEYLSDLFGESVEGEGKLHTGIFDMPGSDLVTIYDLLRSGADGDVNHSEHDVSPNAIQYEHEFVLNEDLREESGLTSISSPSGTIDAKGWLAFWGHDGYLYGAGAMHPRMRRGTISNPMDDRTYLEKELEDQLEVEVSLDVKEALDRDIQNMFGGVKDA